MLTYPTVEFQCLAVCDVEIKAREVHHAREDGVEDKQCSELTAALLEGPGDG